MKHYDFVMAGGGAAGLSLAYHLINSPLRDRSILIIDRDAKDRNDRTWCFWSAQPTPFDEIAYRTWDRLKFISEDFAQTFDLGAYRYRTIRGIDFYRFTRERLAARPNIEFVRGTVERIDQGAQGGAITVDGLSYSGEWVFDSTFNLAEFKPDPKRHHYLKQHFKGWEIEASAEAFDPRVPVLFDFRTPQNGAMRFIYILPFSERRALIEYTLFSADVLRQEEYEQGLKEYIETKLEIREYRVVEEESGIIPMSDHPFPRRIGRRVMNIGTQGGRAKPSSGYAFLRIQRDSAAIVQSLIRHDHPFDVPKDSARYRLFDSIMLQIMYRQGELVQPIFTELFKNNPIRRVFRFLDEVAPLRENIPLLASLPPRPFLRALFRLKVLRRV